MNRKFLSTLAIAIGVAASASAQTAPATSAPAQPAVQNAQVNPAAPVPTSRPATGPTKIGIVNIQAAVTQTAEGKREVDGLTKRFGPKQQELQNLNTEVDNLKKQLTAGEAKLSQEERVTRARAIETKEKSLQRSLEDARGEFEAAQGEAFSRIFQRMVGVMESYARSNGYGVILDVSNPQTTPVLWASEGTNITGEIISAYDAQFPASASGAPSAPSANRPAAPSTARPPAATPQQKPPATTPR